MAEMVVNIYSNTNFIDPDPDYEREDVEPYTIEAKGRSALIVGERGNLLYGDPSGEGKTIPHGPELKPKRSSLPIAEDVTGPVICVLEHKHDGTSWFTREAISAVTETAEKVASERGGSWETSKVRILHRLERGYMPYGKDVQYMREVVAIAMRPTPAP